MPEHDALADARLARRVADFDYLIAEAATTAAAVASELRRSNFKAARQIADEYAADIRDAHLVHCDARDAADAWDEGRHRNFFGYQDELGQAVQQAYAPIARHAATSRSRELATCLLEPGNFIQLGLVAERRAAAPRGARPRRSRGRATRVRGSRRSARASASAGSDPDPPESRPRRSPLGAAR